MIGSVAGADTYFTSTSHNATWTALTADQKTEALTNSTLYLNSRVNWKGSLSDYTQADSWPRKGIIDHEGRDIDDATTPTDIENASYELALIDSGGDIFSNDTQVNQDVILSRVRAGEVESEEEYTPGSGRNAVVGQTQWNVVNALIRPYVRDKQFGRA